jgi:hypothetical protein
MHKTRESGAFVPFISAQERLQGRDAILAILAAAAADSEVLSRLAASPGAFSLSPEELAGLVGGDMKTIERWLVKLDREQAAWLWAWLKQARLDLERKRT